MDHVVYLDAKAKELDKLLTGKKTMLIRGAAGRKIPYGRVDQGDILYLLENDGTGRVCAKANVGTVVNSEKMDTKQSAELIRLNQNKLKLTDAQLKRWSGKRYLVLVELMNIEKTKPFGIDKTEYGNMDDWLLVGDILNVKI
jgi:hypothetical protein